MKKTGNSGKNFWKKAASILAALLFWGLIWFLLAKKVGVEFVLPDPAAVLRRLGELVVTGEFYLTLALSFVRILAGFSAGVILGTLLAFAAKWKPVEALFSPLMAVVRATPVASFIIVVILLADKESVPAFIAFLMVLPVVWQNVRLGIESVDKNLLEMAKVFRVGRGRRFLKIELPSILPYFLSSVRLSIGLAWKAGVAAEVLSMPKISIGTMIYTAKINLDSVDVFAWTAAIIVISVILEKLFSLLWKKGGARRAADQKSL